MEIENLFRYTALAVGLKPSASQGEARLRGLYRIIYSKTISPRLCSAKPACAGESEIIAHQSSQCRKQAMQVKPKSGSIYRRRFIALIRFLWRLCLAFVKLTIAATILMALAVFVVYRHYSRDLPDPAQIGRHRPAETGRSRDRKSTRLNSSH